MDTNFTKKPIPPTEKDSFLEYEVSDKDLASRKLV